MRHSGDGPTRLALHWVGHLQPHPQAPPRERGQHRRPRTLRFADVPRQAYASRPTICHHRGNQESTGDPSMERLVNGTPVHRRIRRAQSSPAISSHDAGRSELRPCRVTRRYLELCGETEGLKHRGGSEPRGRAQRAPRRMPLSAIEDPDESTSSKTNRVRRRRGDRDDARVLDAAAAITGEWRRPPLLNLRRFTGSAFD